MAKSFSQFQRVEVGFDLDNFRDPIGFSSKDAWIRQIVHLCIMDPGTIPSNPSIGIGAKRFDFMLEADRQKLQDMINIQVPKFYPDMPFRKCTIIPSDDPEMQDVIYLIIELTSSTENMVVVALKRSYHYIDYAIAM